MPDRPGNPASILFAIEKTRAQQLISTEVSLITENSRLLSGQRGQPVKLKKYLNTPASIFRALARVSSGRASRCFFSHGVRGWLSAGE